MNDGCVFNKIQVYESKIVIRVAPIKAHDERCLLEKMQKTVKFSDRLPHRAFILRLNSLNKIILDKLTFESLIQINKLVSSALTSGREIYVTYGQF